MDGFGNICTRIVAPVGPRDVATDFVDPGFRPARPGRAGRRRSTPVEELPDDVLVFLLGSRYCETDRLTDTAWSLFGQAPPGWARVQAICDFVHDRITFGYQHARADPHRVGGLSGAASACAATSRIWRSRSAAA